AGVLSGRVSPAALPGEPPRARASARRAAGLAPRAPRAPGAARRRGVRTRCVATLLQPATQKTKVGAPGALRPGSRAVQATGHEGRREVHPPESLLEERERGRTKRRGGGRQRDRKRCAGVRRRGRSCRRCSRWPPLRGHPRRGAPLRYSPRACG
ncbi:unnamed protein product, partial [Prorocentrum cordatum]